MQPEATASNDSLRGRKPKSPDGPRSQISLGFTAKELYTLRLRATASGKPLHEYLRDKCLK